MKLNQGFLKKASQGFTARFSYTPEDYRALATRFQKKLSAKLIGSAFRRYRRVIPVYLSLEGGINDWGQNCGDYHLHLLVRRPEHVAPELFSKTVMDFWKRERATKRCELNTAVKIEPICPQTIATLASYLSKQGTSGLDPLLTHLPN